MGPKKVLDVDISKIYYQIGNQYPRIHTRTKFHLKQIIFKFWDQIGPKKVLGPKFRKTITHIRNQHLRIHTNAKFCLRQSIFKFLDQIRYFWDKMR